MHIRRKKNRSGTTSIVVVDKTDGKYKELISIGTSSLPNELEDYYKAAQQWIKNRQGIIELDFNDYRRQTEQFLNQIDRIQINGSDILLTKIFNDIGFSQIGDAIFKHFMEN